MADAKRVEWAERRAQVAELVRRHEQEKVAFKQLAAEAGMQLPTLYAWAQRLRREQVPSDGPSAPPTRARPGFVELAGTGSERDARAGSGLEVVLASGLRIRVAASFEATTLRRLLVALG